MVEWILTYLLHSTLLLGGALLVPVRSPALRAALLKVALLGGVLSASLQPLLDVEPLGGTLSLQPSRPTPTVVARDVPLAPRMTGAAERFVEPVALPAAPPSPPAWPRHLLHAVAALAALMLAALALAWLRLGRRLRGRTPIRSGPARESLDRLRACAGVGFAVRLSACPRIRVPLALGVIRPEICLPPRALADLDREQLEALLAHELAHLKRRDPAWLALFGLVETVLVLQPLNRLARRRWQEAAECLCDEDAADLLVSGGLGLARCLAEVAGWMTDRRPAALAVAAARMAGNRSVLGRRIGRLLGPAAPRRRRAAWWAPLLLAALVVFAPRAHSGPDPVAGLDRLPLKQALRALDTELTALERELATLAIPDEALARALERSVAHIERRRVRLRELLDR